jgi:hypothetical protein
MVRFYLFKTCVEWDYSEVCSHVLPSGSPLLYPLIMFLDRTAVVERSKRSASLFGARRLSQQSNPFSPEPQKVPTPVYTDTEAALFTGVPRGVILRRSPRWASLRSGAATKAVPPGDDQDGSTRLWCSAIISLLRMRTSSTISSRMSSRT